MAKGPYYDQGAVVHYQKKLEQIFYQTKFRTEKFLTRKPYAEGSKGGAVRINREFSEGVAVDLTARFSPKVPTHEQKYDSRWLFPKHKVIVDFFDEKDILNVLNDPMGTVQQRQMEAFNRTLDMDVVRAMFDTVQVGPELGATTAVSFAADGGMTVDMTGGATYDKLLEIMEILIDREVINDDTPKIYMSIDGGMNTEFLQELELTSSDYATVRRAADGTISGWGPIEFIRFGSGDDVTDKILPVSGGVRTGFAIVPGAMEFQVQRGLTVEGPIKHDQTHHDTWSITTKMSYGFLRMDARKIIRILMDAS